jgi:hypothetical protein
MSRAFVKEPDGDQVIDELPERVHSPHVNYVTPVGTIIPDLFMSKLRYPPAFRSRKNRAKDRAPFLLR